MTDGPSPIRTRCPRTWRARPRTLSRTAQNEPSSKSTAKQGDRMPKAYILITEDVKDPAGMAEYGKLASQAMAGATLLSFDSKAEVIEGNWHGTQTVLLEFESEDAAREWYYSDAYQEAAKLRQAAADCNGVILHGL